MATRRYTAHGTLTAELTIEIRANVTHTDMSMYGGPDRVGWPEEHDEEREVVSVYLDTGKRNVRLPEKLAEQIAYLLQAEIDDEELTADERDDGE